MYTSLYRRSREPSSYCGDAVPTYIVIHHGINDVGFGFIAVLTCKNELRKWHSTGKKQYHILNAISYSKGISICLSQSLYREGYCQMLHLHVMLIISPHAGLTILIETDPLPCRLGPTTRIPSTSGRRVPPRCCTLSAPPLSPSGSFHVRQVADRPARAA